MPLQIPCPCGKTLKVPDNLAGKKVKCPACAEILEVPASPPLPVFDPDVVFDEISSSSRPPKVAASTEPPANPSESATPVSVVGGTTIMLPGGFVLPSPFRSQASLITLNSGRVIERSQRLVGTRHVELLLKRVDSAEICSRGNAAFLILGFMTVGLYGLGLLFLLLYLLMKANYLVIRSGSNAIVVRATGDRAAYDDFRNAVLLHAASAN